MPYRATQVQRPLFPKARYRVSNWAEYDRAHRYSDLAIETGHVLRLTFGRPWRQTEGLLRSIATLLGVSIEIPDHTTFS